MGKEHGSVDVLVIGAGASGAALTWSLSQAGIKVVCLEQGGWVSQSLFPVSEPGAQLHLPNCFHADPRGDDTCHKGCACPRLRQLR